MFEWLENELQSINTPRFHVVDGPADNELRKGVMESPLNFPEPYKEFVLRFGNTSLYRNSRIGYTVGVLAGPRAMAIGHVKYYQIGYNDGNTALMRPEHDSPVYELREQQASNAAKDFSGWLKDACVQARNTYSADEWSDVLRGPLPFTEREREIVQARRNITWRLLDIDSSGDHVFEVSNNARIALPVLTVGARSRNRRLNGAILLKTGDIAPGHTKTIAVSCYKGLVPPKQLKFFPLPDPEPEDREYYDEFRAEGNSECISQ